MRPNFSNIGINNPSGVAANPLMALTAALGSHRNAQMQAQTSLWMHGAQLGMETEHQQKRRVTEAITRDWIDQQASARKVDATRDIAKTHAELLQNVFDKNPYMREVDLYKGTGSMQSRGNELAAERAAELRASKPAVEKAPANKQRTSASRKPAAKKTAAPQEPTTVTTGGGLTEITRGSAKTGNRREAPSSIAQKKTRKPRTPRTPAAPTVQKEVK